MDYCGKEYILQPTWQYDGFQVKSVKYLLSNKKTKQKKGSVCKTDRQFANMYLYYQGTKALRHMQIKKQEV